MKLVYFTKPLAGGSIEETIEFARQVGANGLDLAVRPGHPVNPDNVSRALPEAAARCRDAGLALPMVTLATDFINPADPLTEAVAAACAQAGVPLIKIGYFPYQGNYRAGVDDCRRTLSGFALIAALHEVTFLCHTHSGRYYGSNCEALSLLLADTDPRQIAAYVDAGHQALNGGPFDLGLELVQSHMAAIAVKDAAWVKGDKTWQRTFVPAGEGLVDWFLVFEAAAKLGFHGPVSVHSEYPYASLDDLRRIVSAELRYYRQHMGG